jgi:hypothetical protein
MMNLLALHYIAAQRGDGLRPELVRLLERGRYPEDDRTFPVRPVSEPAEGLISQEKVPEGRPRQRERSLPR